MKKILLSCFLFACFSTAFSQRFINGVGICAFSTGGSGFNSFITGGITYSPRVNVVESDNSSVSLGLPLSLGIGYSSRSDGTASASAVINIPFIVNYNIGCGSTRQSEDRIGFFAGGGFGYHVAAYASDDNNSDGETTKVESVGLSSDLQAYSISKWLLNNFQKPP
jgi:hypothetical protein